MLSRILGYVERARFCLVKNLFFLESNDKMQTLCKLPTPSMVLLAKNQPPTLPLSNNNNELGNNNICTKNLDSSVVAAVDGVNNTPKDDKKQRQARRER